MDELKEETIEEVLDWLADHRIIEFTDKSELLKRMINEL